MKAINTIQPNYQNINKSATKVASNTCPHGMPFGSCPVCSGGGGGSSVKKNQMSWNEGYGIWMSILAARKNTQLRKEFFQQSLMTDQAKHQLELANIFKFITAASAIQQFFSNLSKPINNLKQNIIKTINTINTIFSNVLNKINHILKDTTAKLQGVFNAISAFFGEQQKILKEFLNKGIENIKKLSFLKHAAKNLGMFLSQKAQQITNFVFEKLNKAKEAFNNLIKRMKNKAEKKKRKKNNEKNLKEQNNDNSTT